MKSRCGEQGGVDAFDRMSETPAMTSPLIQKLLRAGAILLITLITLEIAVRVWGYADRHIYDPIYRPFERSRDIPYIHKPGLVNARARGLAIINTDSLGLRARIAGAAYGPKRPSEFRIAIAGDSYTFGEGVARTEDTFAQVLEDLLNHRQEATAVKVFNFGASAYSVKQMTATLRDRMLDLQPDLVIMAVITSDFNLARTPTIDAEGYLIDQNVPQISAPGSAFRAILRRIHVAHVVREIGVRWLYPPPDMGKLFSQGDVPDTYGYVTGFKSLAAEHGIPYVVVLLPKINGGWGGMPARLSRDEVTHLDLSSLRQDFTEAQYMASVFDAHPSAAVHHRIGERLADYVQSRREFPR